jgi:hypothetical protein
LLITETIPDVENAQVGVGFGAGVQYLVIEVADGPGRCWVCAPISDLAVECVRSGRASPWAAAHHSATGTVDIFRELGDGSLEESVVLCSVLPDRGPALVAA